MTDRLNEIEFYIRVIREATEVTRLIVSETDDADMESMSGAADLLDRVYKFCMVAVTSPALESMAPDAAVDMISKAVQVAMATSLLIGRMMAMSRITGRELSPDSPDSPAPDLAAFRDAFAGTDLADLFKS